LGRCRGCRVGVAVPLTASVAIVISAALAAATVRLRRSICSPEREQCPVSADASRSVGAPFKTKIQKSTAES
jgi:hypothetical protein